MRLKNVKNVGGVMFSCAVGADIARLGGFWRFWRFW